MDFIFSVGDWVKIILGVAGIVVVWIERRQISNLLGSLIIGGQMSEVEGKSDTEILERTDGILKRLLS